VCSVYDRVAAGQLVLVVAEDVLAVAGAGVELVDELVEPLESDFLDSVAVEVAVLDPESVEDVSVDDELEPAPSLDDFFPRESFL
jgi:hypothetical protein